jgi:hypothetical protein
VLSKVYNAVSWSSFQDGDEDKHMRYEGERELLNSPTVCLFLLLIFFKLLQCGRNGNIQLYEMRSTSINSHSQEPEPLIHHAAQIWQKSLELT